MKIFLIALTSLFLFAPHSGSGQTWDEWFHQGTTQQEYHQVQVAALWNGLDQVVKGANIAFRGWFTINNIADGNFNLSRDFFGHLKNVSPAISGSTKLIDILVFQYYMTLDLKGVYDRCANDGNFSAQEIRYIGMVYTNFLKLSDLNISEALSIIWPSEMQMSDAERLNQIERIHAETLDQQAFVKSFGYDVSLLSKERQKERSTIAYQMVLNGY